MCRVIQYILAFVTMFIFIAVAIGQDAFDQTVAQIKALETKLEESRQRVEKTREQSESEIAEFRKSHKLNAPKDMFESDADYDERIHQLDALVEKRRDALRERYFEDMQRTVGKVRNQIAHLYRRVFPTNEVTVTLGTYNANNEFFPITFEINLNEEKRSWESRLNIKKNDARKLYHDWDKVTKMGYLSIDPGYRRALAMVKLVYPPILEEGVTWSIHEVYDLGNNDSVAFSPDGKYLATDTTLWKVDNGKKVHQLDGVSRSLNAISFSPDGKYLATGDTRNVTLWEVNRGRKIWQQQESYQYQRWRFSNKWETAWASFFAVSFSPDGKYLATGDTRNVTLWDVSDGKQVWQEQQSYRYRPSPVLANRETAWASFPDVSFSPDGKYLATRINGFRNRREVVLWQVNGGRVVRRMGHSSGVVSFSPNGKYFAIGAAHNVTLWDVGSGTKIWEMEHADNSHATAFSPDGQYLAVGGDDKAITFYQIPENITIETQITKEKVIQASSGVTDLAWSPYGNLISDGKKVYRTLLQPEIYDVEKTVR